MAQLKNSFLSGCTTLTIWATCHYFTWSLKALVKSAGWQYFDSSRGRGIQFPDSTVWYDQMFPLLFI